MAARPSMPSRFSSLSVTNSRGTSISILNDRPEERGRKGPHDYEPVAFSHPFPPPPRPASLSSQEHSRQLSYTSGTSGPSTPPELIRADSYDSRVGSDGVASPITPHAFQSHLPNQWGQPASPYKEEALPAHPYADSYREPALRGYYTQCQYPDPREYGMPVMESSVLDPRLAQESRSSDAAIFQPRAQTYAERPAHRHSMDSRESRQSYVEREAHRRSVDQMQALPHHAQPAMMPPRPASRTQNGQRRFPCRFARELGCTKSFTTSGHASRHSKIHSDEKGVACEHEGCNKRFTRQDNMKQHMEVHRRDRDRPRGHRGTVARRSTPSKAGNASRAEEQRELPDFEAGELHSPMGTSSSPMRAEAAGNPLHALAHAAEALEMRS